MADLNESFLSQLSEKSAGRTSMSNKSSDASKVSAHRRVSRQSGEVFDQLPRGAFSEEVAAFVVSEQEEVDIAECIGPAIPQLRWVGVVEVVAVLCFFPLTYVTTDYNIVWIVKYLFLIPPLLYRLYVEFVALQHLIPPYVYDAIRTIDAKDLWQVFGKSTSFEMWLFVYSGFTGLNVCNAFLDTGVAASTVWKMSTDGGRTQRAYEEMWQGGFLDKRGIPCPNIVWLITIAWLCTLAQHTVHLVYTIPKGPVKYELRNSGLQHHLFQRLNNEGVFFFLAEASGMAPIQNLAFRQALYELRRIEPEVMISYVQPMALLMLKRTAYSWVLRNCVQVFVQTLIFSIEMHLQQSRGELQTILSILVGIMMTAQKLTELRNFEKYTEIAESMWVDDEGLKKYIEANPQNAMFKTWKQSFWKMQYGIRCVAAFTVGSLVFNFARLIMTSFFCPNHLWDVGGCQ